MQPPSRRRLELDALRGLMLVWITCTHLPTVASTYVNQPFGFVSAAEGFIFLSALFTGRIYYRLAQHDGYRPMTLKLWARTVRLYLYHALLLAFVFLVAVPIASRGNRPGLHNLLDFYFDAGARRAVVEAFLLIYRPPLLDILPMYIIFLVFTSAALLITRRIPWKYILGTGFVIWTMAQFGFRAHEHALISKIIPTHIPLNEMGSFDLWAWQFLWIVGIYLGVRWGRGDLDIDAWSKRLMIPSIIVTSALFELRRALNNGQDLGPFEAIFDKWHLGPVRLLNFAAVAVVAHPASTGSQAFGIPPASLARTSLFTGVLRASPVRLRRSHPPRQRRDAKRSQTNSTARRHLHRHAHHRQTLLQDRSQTRAPTQTHRRRSSVTQTIHLH